MDFQHVGPLLYLMPFLEQDAYFKKWSFNSAYTFWWQDPKNRPPTTGLPWEPIFPLLPAEQYGCGGKVTALLCPSAPSPEQAATALMTTCQGNPGQDFTIGGMPTNYYNFSGAPGHKVMTRSHYVAVAGDWYYENRRYLGPFWYSRDGRGNKLTAFLDGTSNTLLFGEHAGKVINWTEYGHTILTAAGIGANGMFTTFDVDLNWAEPTEASATNDDFHVRFSSAHPGIIQFAFGDGSVRPLRSLSRFKNDLFPMFLALGGVADGVSTAGVLD